MGSAHDVEVAVLLALHGVVTEVRQQPEPARTERFAELDGDAADAADVLPQLRLGAVLLRHGQEHHRRPPEDVLDHDHLVVFVHDGRRFPACDDVAEHAVRTHGAPSMVDGAWLPLKRRQKER